VARRRQVVACPRVEGAVAAVQPAAIEERRHERHAEPPGEVVVAGAGAAQRGGAGALPQGPDRGDGGEPAEGPPRR
jgi:hypothetical protein